MISRMRSQCSAFAVVDDLQSLIIAIRRRVDALGISLETLEFISGIQQGYASKCLCPGKPLRRASPFIWFLMLQALGLRVALVEDAEAMERLGKKWEQRRARKPVRSSSTYSERKPIKFEIAPDRMRRIQSMWSSPSRLAQSLRNKSSSCTDAMASCSPTEWCMFQCT